MKLIQTEFNSWDGEIQLPTWAGFQSRRGPYASVDSPTPSSGRVKFVYAPEGRGREDLGQFDLELLEWFKRHEASVSHAVIAAILEWCSPEARPRRLEFGLGDDFPAIRDVQTLKQHIGLYSVFVHYIAYQTLPYIGFELGCDWEEEHGLGVLMHGTRCVEIGHADSAFTLWRAKKDAGIDQ
jgi:hypothetical protein